ncbi:MAG TPA: endonuclease/exonuclease/phosphatase family protein [Acidimicrobiales bacterium]|nr:endonuclease/exonuclease/phosphatase family protein [Acidimicrobiales bacterium]
MLRVMTLNIWNLSGPWEERRGEIVAWLDEVEPDVVCLQEVVQSEDQDQAEWLADAAAVDYHVAFGGSLDFGGGQFGNAVLSRWTVEESHNAQLPYDADRGDMQRTVLHARTRGMDVFSTHLTHLKHAGALREAEVAELVRVVEQRAADDAAVPPVVAGDFNAEPESTEVRHLCGLTSLNGRSTYFQDAWRVAGGSGPGLTWDNRNPFAATQKEIDRRLDYVFVGWRKQSGAGRVRSARVVCDVSRTGTFASDHYGVVAEVDEG